MAYLEQIKSSKMWTCPKTGYYKVVCVGGGGGGGGAGYYSKGIVHTLGVRESTMLGSHTGSTQISVPLITSYRATDCYKSYNSSTGYINAYEPLFKAFSKDNTFIGGTTSGKSGSSGGTTSFGDFLTALGGSGGNGGGAPYKTDEAAIEYHPTGGKSKYSSGGMGDSMGSVFFELGSSAPYIGTTKGSGDGTHLTGGAPYPRIPRYCAYPQFSNLDSALAVSGAGGAGGDIETSIVFIEKGVQVPCTIGVGGSGGNNGNLSIKSSLKLMIGVGTQVSTQSGGMYLPFYYDSGYGGFTFVGSNSTLVSSFPIFMPFTLNSNLKGGGGGGGYTLSSSGGRGGYIASFSEGYGAPYANCSGFIESRESPTFNGGTPGSDGIGYGAGGAGGDNITSICLGTPSTIPISENQSTGTGQCTIGDAHGSRIVNPKQGNSGSDGIIIIQEV